MNKWFFFSDMQMPLHDTAAVELAFKVMAWFKPDVVVNIGDLVDGVGTSRWADGSTDEVFASILEENLYAQEYWARVRKMRPKARLIWTLGNHDIRPFEYVDKKAPALKELITQNSLWGVDDFGVEVYPYNKPPQIKMGDVYIHHGVTVSKHAGDSARGDVESWGVSIVRGHCFSEDTEIMTPDGWKDYQSIDKGSKVYTLNTDTGAGEFQEVSEKFVYSNYNKMVSIKGMSIDALVTEDHQMILKTTNSFNRIKASELMKRRESTIPLSAPLNAKDANISDEKIKMISWIMAEGNFDKYTLANGDARYRIRLSQSEAPDGRLDRLSALMKDCNITTTWYKRYSAGTTTHGTYRNFDAFRTNIKRGESLWVYDYINPETKHPLGEMFNLSARQAQLFLMEYAWSDGCKNSDAKNSYQLATNNDAIKDYLQYLATIAGWRSSAIRRPKNMWAITINNRSSTRLTKSNFDHVDYSGDVWCVTVPNHTVVVRRKGKVFIAGNSHRLGSYHKTYEIKDESLSGYEIGHLMDVNKAEYTQVHNWQQGFAVGYEDNDIGTIDLIRILPGYACYYGGKKFTLN